MNEFKNCMCSFIFRNMSNYLLEKTGLGEVKKGFHNLPHVDHIYGKPLTRDEYGAREGTSNAM